jgi:hypothetical protein
MSQLRKLSGVVSQHFVLPQRGYSKSPSQRRSSASQQAGRASPGPRLNPVSNKPLNMRFMNAPLTRIISFIGSVTGIAITYENGYVDIPTVTIDVKEATLEEALNQILTPNRLSYKVVDERSILIVRRVQ